MCILVDSQTPSLLVTITVLLLFLTLYFYTSIQIIISFLFCIVFVKHSQFQLEDAKTMSHKSNQKGYMKLSLYDQRLQLNSPPMVSRCRTPNLEATQAMCTLVDSQTPSLLVIIIVLLFFFSFLNYITTFLDSYFSSPLIFQPPQSSKLVTSILP